MKTKIKKLSSSEFEAVLELYAETCHKDRFYCQLFKTDDCYSDIKKFFRNDVWSTLQFGHALGAFAGKQLIGVLLGFNLQQWYNGHREEFNHVFNFDNDKAQYWYDSVSVYFRQNNKRTVYIYMIGVDEQFRRKGVASMLIKETVNMYKRDYAILSDVSNPKAMPMWFRNGFKEIHIGSGDTEVLLLSNV